MTTISENDIVDLTNGTVQRTEYGQMIMALGSNNRSKFLRLDNYNNQKTSLYNSTGSPITSTDPLEISLSDNIPTSTFLLEVGKGNIAKHSNVRWTSWSDDVGESYQSININGKVIYPFPTVAAVRSVKSTSVNDTSLGTGARIVLVQGLDTNYDPIQEFVTLNGTTPVTTTSLFLRFNKVIIISAGNTGSNEGTIDVYTGTDIYVRVRINDNLGVSGAITVPNGKTYYPIGTVFDVNKDADIEFISRTRPFGGLFFNANPVFFYQNVSVTAGLAITPLSAKTDLTPIIRKIGGAGIAKVTFILDIISVDD